MKVILLENLKRIGSIGEIIDVKRGYARNFLIANKKALYASKEKSSSKVEVFLLRELDTDLWEAMVKPARKVRIGNKLFFNDKIQSFIKF